MRLDDNIKINENNVQIGTRALRANTNKNIGTLQKAKTNKKTNVELNDSIRKSIGEPLKAITLM